MRPRGLRRSRPLLWSVVAAVAVLCAAGLYAYLRSPTRNLPYHDSFSGGNAGEWKAFGGTWETADDSMRNDSDERGAKLVTGSPYWRNYSIEADVSMLGSSGDAGLIIRTSDEEQGVDAYSGYYAGIRNIDNSLVLGRAGHGWIEDVLKLKPASAEMAQWYHLKLLAYDCHVVAAMSNASGSGMATVSVTDKDCLRSGRAGLRSYGSGGIWRKVVIQSATAGDLNAMLERGKQTGSSMEPLPGRGREVHEFKVPLQMPEGYAFHSSQNTQSIASLRLLSSARATPAVVRGNVILTSPTLFIQDNTGGVSVPMPMSVPSLKLGDEVEASGLATPGDFSPVLEHATVRTLWDGTPIPPVTVTASQAAMGSFDATFIEVEGRLRSKQYGANNTLLLNFDVGSQAFRAVMNRGRGDYLFGKLKAGSLLRMRGVCVVDPAYTDNLTPFILLLRSTEDIDVLAGPPWWSAGHLAAMAIGFLLLALTANFIYHRIESWRLRAVLEERERLAHEMHDTLAQSFAGTGFNWRRFAVAFRRLCR